MTNREQQLAEALGRVQSWLLGLGYSVECVDPNGTLQEIIGEALRDADLSHAQQLAREEDQRRWLHKMMDQERKELNARLERLLLDTRRLL